MNGIATLKDVEAVEARGLPADLPASTYEMIRAGTAIDPQAPALSFFLSSELHRQPETWTYAQLLARITQAANLFHELGASKDTVIAFVLPNLPETHWTIWGGQAAGIVTAINPMLEPAAIADLLNAAGTEILVTLAQLHGTDLWPKMQQVVPRLSGLRHLVLVNLADRVPGREGGAGLPPRDDLPDHIELHDFNSEADRQPSQALLSGRRFAAGDISSYFCTGGTTGLPKIAMRTHGNEVANAWSAAQFFGDSIGPGKNLFCGLPLFHVNAVLVTGLLPFSLGAHVVLGTPGGFRGEGVIHRFWEIVEQHRINFFSGVPTLYASLLDVPIGERRVSSLEYGICGAAPMPVEVFRNFQERTGLKILEGYGLTECTCVSTMNPPQGERRLGSIGMRIPGQQMKAVMIDEQGAYVRDCAPGEAGVLLISGANVFAGYKLPEQNKGLWIDLKDGRRWLNTGDLGRQDAEGYFWLTGRKKELIIRGGHNIDPLTIEEPLHRHPAVQVAAAVGRPDPHAGELPVAYVQLKAGSSVTEKELAEFLKQEIAERAALPKQIRIIAQMPLTGVGKIFKPELKHREARDALGAALAEAGIGVREISVSDDKKKGTVVQVALAPGASEEQARQVLGRFSFPFTLG